jgi:arsenite methyltransferase
MTIQSPTSTHQAVQTYYGKVAQAAGSCCAPAAPQETIHNDLYPPELLAGIPADIANFTEGSGDPVTLANLKPGEHVLDLGSGGGLDCFLAARLVGEGGQVTGVEMTPEMLQRARSNAARLNYANVEFREGYLEALPVADGSMDVIISNCVINLTPDKPQVFREMIRALKPGGRIAISDIVAHRPLPEAMRAGQEDWCACTSGALQRGDYIEELGKAGFMDIHFEMNIDVMTKAVENGSAQSVVNMTVEQMLDSLRDPEKLEQLIVAPYKITARKPA